MRSVIRISALSSLVPVVTLEEAKAHLRLETEDDDEMLERIVAAATSYLEKLCWTSFAPAQWELVLSGFPWCDIIHLERGPLVSVDSVKYRDPDGVEQTFSSSAYWVDTAHNAGAIWLKSTSSWPDYQERPDAVRVRFTVGYATPDDVPPEIKQAILLLTAHLYEERSPEVSGTITAKFSMGLSELIAPHRMMRF